MNFSEMLKNLIFGKIFVMMIKSMYFDAKLYCDYFQLFLQYTCLEEIINLFLFDP